MTIYFSKTTKGFYPLALKQKYVSAGTWPADAVELTEEEIQTYQGKNAPEGKKLGSVGGRPAWVDLPSPTPEQLKQQRIGELKALLAATDFKVLPDYQVRSGKTDAEMQEVYAERKAWYDELQGLL